MENEIFKYIISNKSKWQEIYIEQKTQEHEKKRLDYMKEYNKTYVRPSKAKKDKSYYILG